MADFLPRPPRWDTAYVCGAWDGTSNYAVAACAAVHPIAVLPASWDAGRRHIAKSAVRRVTATWCDPCRSYRAASSYSSHAPSSRAAGAAGECCDPALCLSLCPSPPCPALTWLLSVEGFVLALAAGGCFSVRKAATALRFLTFHSPLF